MLHAILLDLLALTGGTVHSQLPGLAPMVNDVLIDGDRILSIGAGIDIPEGAQVIDVTGLHIVPGLIDGMISYDPEHDALYVSRGITTVRDMGGEAANLNVLRSPELRDRTPGPFLLSAGSVLDGQPPQSSAALPIGNAQQLEASVSALANSFFVDFLSVQPGFPGALVPRLGELAQGNRLDLWGMRPRDAEISTLVDAGWRGLLGLDSLLPTGVQWAFVQPGAFNANLAAIADAGIAVVPMASELDRFLSEPDLAPAVFEHLGVFYEGQWKAEWRARKPLLEDEDALGQARRILPKRAALFERLIASDVALLPGSAAPLSWAMPGDSLLDELQTWVEAGMEPGDVLRRATADAARLVGVAADRGALAPGRIADLVVLDSDPRVTLSGFRSAHAVMVRGRYLDRAALDSMLALVAAKHMAVRESLSRPLEVEAPELPEGALVLAGQVETFGLDARLSAERFAVVREPDGAVSVVGRVRVPASGGIAESQLEIFQRLRDGQLENLRLRLSSGGEELILTGLWEPATRTFRTERRLNGAFLAGQNTTERPRLLTLDPITDSVTAALILGQIEEDGEIAVFDLGAQLEPSVDTWIFETVPSGARQVRVRQGAMQFRYGPGGVPLEVRRISGRSEALTTNVIEMTSAFGGAGFPVRFVAPKAPPEGSAGAQPEGPDGGAETPEPAPQEAPQEGSGSDD